MIEYTQFEDTRSYFGVSLFLDLNMTDRVDKALGEFGEWEKAFQYTKYHGSTWSGLSEYAVLHDSESTIFPELGHSSSVVKDLFSLEHWARPSKLHLYWWELWLDDLPLEVWAELFRTLERCDLLNLWYQITDLTWRRQISN